MLDTYATDLLVNVAGKELYASLDVDVLITGADELCNVLAAYLLVRGGLDVAVLPSWQHERISEPERWRYEYFYAPLITVIEEVVGDRLDVTGYSELVASLGELLHEASRSEVSAGQILVLSDLMAVSGGASAGDSHFSDFLVGDSVWLRHLAEGFISCGVDISKDILPLLKLPQDIASTKEYLTELRVKGVVVTTCGERHGSILLTKKMASCQVSDAASETSSLSKITLQTRLADILSVAQKCNTLIDEIKGLVSEKNEKEVVSE